MVALHRWTLSSLLLLGLSLLVTPVLQGAENPLAYYVFVGNKHTDINFGLRFPDGGKSSLIMREVLRQSLLLAAREEMGLLTGDEVLGERAQGPSTKSLEIVVKRYAGSPRIQVLRGSPGSWQEVWKQTFDRDEAEAVGSLLTEIPFAEKLSRNQFVKALEKAGYTKRPHPKPKDRQAPLPEELVKRFHSEFTFDQQFMLLRELHEQIATEGETPARLGGLVLVYTNLGVLTEHLWHSMSYAFKARALLYAERMVGAGGDACQARWHRAYAHTLVGAHDSALRNLASVKLIQDGSASPQPEPAWVPLLEALCRYDFDALEKLRKSDTLPQLTHLVSFLAYEQEGSKNQALAKGLEFEKVIPECYRMHDSLYLFSGVSAGHYTSRSGLARLAQNLQPRLSRDKQLPVSIQHVLEESSAAKGNSEIPTEIDPEAEVQYRAKLVDALLESSDLTEQPDERAEPSWPVLGEMIAEVSFLQVLRRADFEKRQFGIPADRFLTSYEPIVKRHPWFLVLNAYRTRGWHAATLGELKKLTIDRDPHPIMYVGVMPWSPNEMDAFRVNAEPLLEPLANEMALSIRFPLGDSAPPQDWLKYTPYSPLAASRLFLYSRPLERQAYWEEVAHKYPNLAAKMGERFEQDGREDDAVKMFAAAIKLDPSRENYFQLAKIYKKQKNDEKWLKTWDDFLKQPDFGLYHAQARVEISQYYVARREWDKALPYANAAATTWAQWALMEGARVNEANQNWEAAEAMVVANIQRYRTSPVEWYLFCKRNNYGDVEVPRRMIMPEGVEKLVAGNGLGVFDLAILQQLEGDDRGALASYEKIQSANYDSFDLMQIALIADSLGDTKKRDEAFRTMIAAKPPVPPAPTPNNPKPAAGPTVRKQFIGLAQLFVADLAAGGKGELPSAEIDVLLKASIEKDRCSLNYFIGAYLAQHGREKEALEHWKKCMGAPLFTLSTRTLAGNQLGKRGVEAKEWKQYLFEQPEEVAPE